MARKPTDYVQFKLRIRESLRRKIERAAEKAAHSANAEAVKRIEHTFDEEDHWEAVHKEMEEERDKIDEQQREYYEEEARREAAYESSLRDTKILNMLMHDRTDSTDLLRLIFTELENSPGWAENSENKMMLADRLRLLILKDEYPPTALLSMPLKGDK